MEEKEKSMCSDDVGEDEDYDATEEDAGAMEGG